MRKDPQKLYKLEEMIGKGAHASVYKATSLDEKKTVAIKIINILRLNDTALAAALNEIRILSSIDNPHIVQYFDSFIDKDQSQLWIVMELMEGGDLNGLIESAISSKKQISERIVWTFLIQALMGLKALHNLNIIHRDLKPGNVYLTADRQSLKLGDMNVSKVTDFSFAQSLIGSPAYLAPEVWLMKPYTNTCDVFSLGCLIFELASFKLPFDAENMAELRNNIINQAPVKLPSNYSSELQSILNKCLLKNPDVRPTAHQLLDNQVIKRKAKELGIVLSEIEYNDTLAEIIPVPKNRFLLNLKLPKKNGKATSELDIMQIKNAKKVLAETEKKASSRSPNRKLSDSNVSNNTKEFMSNHQKISAERSLAKDLDEKQPNNKDAFKQTTSLKSKEGLLEKLADFGLEEYFPVKPKVISAPGKNAISADNGFLDKFFTQPSNKTGTTNFDRRSPYFQDGDVTTDAKLIVSKLPQGAFSKGPAPAQTTKPVDKKYLLYKSNVESRTQNK